LSLNVLVIPEDFRRDQYLLQPLLQRIIERSAVAPRVRVCLDPLLGGIREALRFERIREVLDRYPMVQCFLLIVDRDGESGRRNRLDEIEAEAKEVLGPRGFLLATAAHQEVEIWGLAGMTDLPKDWRWPEMRAEVHCKETYFEPYVRQRRLEALPCGGRRTLGLEASGRISRVLRLCDEDLGDLDRRLSFVLTAAK
jgi:hypothetical protein